MKIAIRMDDITPDMDWERFETFKALLDEYQIKPLIGIVPDNRDENLNQNDNRIENGFLRVEHFWQQVKGWEDSGWHIALHGYQHVYTSKKGGCFPLNHFSEFAGLSYEKQKEMLNAGKQIFSYHGITTDIFMAPAHSYDKNTLKALRELGYCKVTDGFGDNPYIWRGITFYPISFRLSNSLKKEKGITTMVIHTNTMGEGDMDRYRKIFETEDMISYGDYLDAPAEERGSIGHMVEYMMACVKHVLVKFL